MAVQQGKKTRSKVRMRRSHDRVAVPAVSVDKTTGETHMRHHITKDGFYRGKLVVLKQPKAVENEVENS